MIPPGFIRSAGPSRKVGGAAEDSRFTPRPAAPTRLPSSVASTFAALIPNGDGRHHNHGLQLVATGRTTMSLHVASIHQL